MKFLSGSVFLLLFIVLTGCNSVAINHNNDYNGASSGEWGLDDSNILMRIYTNISK